MYDDQEVLTTAECAEYLKLNEDTVRRYIREKKLDAYCIGNKVYRVKKQDIWDFLNNCKKQSR